MDHSLLPLLANDRTRERSHRRSSMASAVQFPVLKFPFLLPRGAPGLSPPCKRQRLRPRMAGHWHGEPARVFARQRAARLRFPSRASTLWFMGLFPNFCCPPSAERDPAGISLSVTTLAPENYRWMPRLTSTKPSCTYAEIVMFLVLPASATSRTMRSYDGR